MEIVYYSFLLDYYYEGEVKDVVFKCKIDQSYERAGYYNVIPLDTLDGMIALNKESLFLTEEDAWKRVESIRHAINYDCEGDDEDEDF